MARVLEILVESVPSWGTRLAYGEKTMIDGHEFVPVAVAAFGFGGGEGSGEMPDGDTLSTQKGEGSGGGGGGYALPIGAYTGGPDGVAFRANPIALLAVSVLLVSAIGTAVLRIVRATR